MDNVYDDHSLRDKSGIFQDRPEAGIHLAGMLKAEFKNDPQTMVLAIPSGGVPVGLMISKQLGLDFDLIIARKLQIPGNTEAGFGANLKEVRSFAVAEAYRRWRDLGREEILALLDDVQKGV